MPLDQSVREMENVFDIADGNKQHAPSSIMENSVSMDS
jgi:hypothetical protein